MKEMKTFSSYMNKNYNIAANIKSMVINILNIEDNEYGRVVADTFIDKYADYIHNIKDVIGNVRTIEDELPHYVIYEYDGCGGLCDPVSFETLEEVIGYVEKRSYTNDTVRSQMDIYDVRNRTDISGRVDQYIDYDRHRYSLVDYENESLRFETDDLDEAEREASKWVDEGKSRVVYVCDRTKEFGNELFAIVEDIDE